MSTRTKRRRALGVALAAALACAGLAGAGLGVTAWRVPDPVAAPPETARLVLDRGGALLHPFLTASGHWRLPVALDEVDPDYLRLLLAYEDKRYREHAGVDWRAVRERQFRREFAKVLGARFACEACGGPVSEAMRACPWCGRQRAIHRGGTDLPRICPRCRRGMKREWRYCAWCYGPGFEPDASRFHADARYERRCANASCDRRLVLPFSRYCPWCRRKVRRRWPIPGSRHRCGH